MPREVALVPDHLMGIVEAFHSPPSSTLTTGDILSLPIFKEWKKRRVSAPHSIRLVSNTWFFTPCLWLVHAVLPPWSKSLVGNAIQGNRQINMPNMRLPYRTYSKLSCRTECSWRVITSQKTSWLCKSKSPGKSVFEKTDLTCKIF